MVLEDHNEMLQGSSSNIHSTDKKASNTVYQKPWVKLTSPVPKSLGEVFFGSRVVVWPESMTTVKGENSVGDKEVNKSNGTRTVEYSVNVDIFSTAITPPQQGTKSGDAQVAEAMPGVTPETVPPSTTVIAGTPGAKKYIKVLRAYRIVLLGRTGDGRSSLGNSILGEDVFKLSGTNKCQIQSKSVHERRITLVDTPGFSETDQPEEHLKDEIVRCTTESAVGPHAFLIVLKVEESTKQQLAVIGKIKQYFSEELFKYAAVVFTHGDQLHEGVNIEQYISQNTCLSDLVKKCSGQYHVVNNKCKLESDDNKFQMSQILNTVDKIVMENKGGCYINKMSEVQRKEDSKTLVEKQPQGEKDKGNNGPPKNVWVSLSGPAGMSVTKAFFGPTVTIWQKTTRVAVNDENKLTDEEEVNENVEATIESESEESSNATEDVPNQKKQKTKEQSGKTNNGKQGDKTVHGQNSWPLLNWSWAAAALAALAALAAGIAGAAGAALALAALAAGCVAGATGATTAIGGGIATGATTAIGGGIATGATTAIDGGIATGATTAIDGGIATGATTAIDGGIATGAAAGMKGAVMAAVKKIVLTLAAIGTATAIVKIVVWIKNIIKVLLKLYNMMKENLGVFLLVVAFYLLLVLTFFARVPMAGALVLSGGVVVLFLLIMSLFALLK